MQSLCQSKVALVREWRLHEFLANTQVLETIEEVSICQLDSKLLQSILLLGIEIESHMVEPGKIIDRFNLLVDQ